MTKKDIVNAVAERAGITKKSAKEIIDTACDVIVENVAAGDKVAITGFGSFDSTVRAEREGHNPQTGERIVIPETKSVKFKAGSAFKAAVKGE